MLLPLLLAGCPGAGDLATPPSGWAALADRELAHHRFDGSCFAPDGTTTPADSWVSVVAADANWVAVDDALALVPRADVTLEGEPATSPEATVRIDTPRLVLDADGCLVLDGAWLEDDAVSAVARTLDENLAGLAAVSTELELADLRTVDTEGWTYPWHSSVQLLLEVDGGFVVGGGAVIGPQQVLTAAHLGVGPGWCVTTHPNTGVAWDEGHVVCDVERVEAHPDGVDAAVVHLSAPLDLPSSPIRTAPLDRGDAYLTSQWGALHRHAFADDAVAAVNRDNAWCEDWPAASTFTATELVIDFGDSGGPAWVGDEVVGIVHGERCRFGFEPVEHVFVHVPGIADWIAGQLPLRGARD